MNIPNAAKYDHPSPHISYDLDHGLASRSTSRDSARSGSEDRDESFLGPLIAGLAGVVLAGLLCAVVEKLSE